MSKYNNNTGDPKLDLALSELIGNTGGNWSIADKRKSLIKFGRRTDLGTSKSTLWEVGPVEETKLMSSDGNLIDRLSSSAAGDTSKSFTVEGHYFDGTDLVFCVQTVTTHASDGQTPVALSQPLARCSRIAQIDGTTAATGDVWVYQSGQTVTGGVPQDLTKTHNVLKGTEGWAQSFKAATSISYKDALILTGGFVGIAKKTSADVEFTFEVREVDKTFWRPSFSLVHLGSTSTPFANILLPTYGVIPPNYDVRVSATASTTNVEANATFFGYLAINLDA